MPYRPVNWQRNYRKIPQHIYDQLKNLSTDEVQVATRLSLRTEDVADGRYSHLGIKLDEHGDVSVPSGPVLPPPEMGRWSTTNVQGWEVVRKDLPMTTMTQYVETPNFGDWSKGSHTVEWTRDVYQRDVIPPKQVALELEVVAKDASKGTAEVLVKADQPLNRNDDAFEEELFYLLNVMQENTGSANVIPAGLSTEEYLDTLAVHWEILPPGERDDHVPVILGRGRQVSEEERRRVVERYDVLKRLKPTNFIAGTNGFRRYFGAQFADDLVVFENVEYGNAAYIMGENWEELSRLSRTELLERAQRDFDRVVHSGDWKAKLRTKLRERLKERQQP